MEATVPVPLLLVLAPWVVLAAAPDQAPLAGGCVLPQAAIEMPALHYDSVIGPIREAGAAEGVPPADCIEEQTGAPILPG
jgi:hypothetical protein